MPLFMCRQCGCVENTACCNYWSRKLNDTPIVCSACDPAIGKWHEEFNRRSAVGMLVDNQGHLWGPDSKVPAHYQIFGAVLAMQSTDAGGAE